MSSLTRCRAVAALGTAPALALVLPRFRPWPPRPTRQRNDGLKANGCPTDT
ncbi:hypothetical protein ACFW4X_20110 [Streptomyces smyrnaeus]|uniref:Twin-arginine translocation signal domain-containing protein n=1 Tax=Streptomyces smyrnaeus TaxID=1387713 RepID=A0ABS3XVA8_9ACTN|nr:hypothetical protein [Streptomyces smyrnaeus]MBO8199284.1 hypothetical protein [Streptomyces smyrnaeus]